MQGEVRTHPSIECLRGRSFGALLRVTMENAAASSSSPVVPGLADSGAIQTKNVQVQDAPIQAATVFTRNRAEITRLLAMPSPAKIGLHEIELSGLPSCFVVDKESIRVNGTGYFTILHVSYTQMDKPPASKKAQKEQNEEQKRAEAERIKKETQILMDEYQVLSQHFTRNQRIRTLADRFVDQATSFLSVPTSFTPEPRPTAPVLTVEHVSKTLDWWTIKTKETDAEEQRLNMEGRRIMGVVAKLHEMPKRLEPEGTQSPGKITITLDVTELGPIELEVKYMIRGATWKPAYDLRVDTQTDTISCSYYAHVQQSTGEDWEGVSLSLSTAEPAIRGTPPTLEPKTVSLKWEKNKPFAPSGFASVAAMGNPGGAFSFSGNSEPVVYKSGDGGGRGNLFGGFGCPSAPPPAPPASTAIAEIEGGGGDGGIGAVSFAIKQPAILKSDGQSKRLTVGILQLTAKVTHYIVPSKEASAFLQAKATNNTDYLLLASDDVSIYFDNSFVNKTSLAFVSPGESFQTFLGVDPAVKIKCAPLRKTSKKYGVFSKSHLVTHVHSTSISNKKKVPVTCVVLGAIPRSTNDIIKVNQQQPPTGEIRASNATSTEALVSEALGMFGPGGGDEDCPSPPSSRESPSAKKGKGSDVSAVAGVVKNSLNHLAWVANVAPQSEVHIPLKYTVEWPIDEDIEISGE